MKEMNRQSQQTLIRVVSHEAMTAEEQSDFNKAVESLLAEWVRHVDRRNQGVADGNVEEQMAG
jgi:hypothetical protein